MGYNTRYTLSIIEGYADEDEINQRMGEISGYASDFFSGDMECKWYSHKEDMKTLSLEYPSVLFLLEGEGEDTGDMWRWYFRNGKDQYIKAKITFDAFDENELKE